MVDSMRVTASVKPRRRDLSDPRVVEEVHEEAKRLVRGENLRRRLRRMRSDWSRKSA